MKRNQIYTYFQCTFVNFPIFFAECITSALFWYSNHVLIFYIQFLAINNVLSILEAVREMKTKPPCSRYRSSQIDHTTCKNDKPTSWIFHVMSIEEEGGKFVRSREGKSLSMCEKWRDRKAAPEKVTDYGRSSSAADSTVYVNSTSVVMVLKHDLFSLILSNYLWRPRRQPPNVSLYKSMNMNAFFPSQFKVADWIPNYVNCREIFNFGT